MQHKSDILDALADPRSRFSDLEDAFRALVAWPQEGMIRGLTGPDDAVALLESIAIALIDIGDMRVMPGHIAELLEAEASRRGWSLVQSTYMAGALYVKKHLGTWSDNLRSAKTDEA